MCDYRNGMCECRGDGYLWDADSDGYDPNEFSQPCPACNTKEFLLYVKEEAETVSCGSNHWYSYTGETIWLGAVRRAETVNSEAARRALAEIGVVEALRPADNEQGFEIVRYVYAGIDSLTVPES